MARPCYNKQQIEDVLVAKGYKWFSSGDYNLNIVGVRKSGHEVTNHFDDCITLSYKVDGDWKFHCWQATTDPGEYWIDNPLNDAGCAILVPGQYRSSHKIGLHQGKYEALRQKTAVKVYRDGDLDDEYDHDPETIQEGLFGINIHRSNPYTESYYVNKWSAGCQVFKRVEDFNDFMEICHTAENKWGNSFTYTLITEEDINAL